MLLDDQAQHCSCALLRRWPGLLQSLHQQQLSAAVSSCQQLCQAVRDAADAVVCFGRLAS